MILKGNFKVQSAYQELKQRLASLPVGYPLPPVPKLIQELGVGRVTIDKVYDLLEQEGRIERRRGAGVYVADRMATGEFAVVILPRLMGPNVSPFYRMGAMAILDAMFERNPRWQVKMHLGRMTTIPQEYPSTLNLLKPEVLRRLRGVFTFHPLYDLEPKLEQVGVPLVRLERDWRQPQQHQVWFDRDLFFQQCVVRLYKSGCRKIGLLWTAAGNRKLTSCEESARIVSELAVGHGMECREAWMPVCPSHFATGGIVENDGYELFHRLWNQAERPDGIIVTDDILCRGVLRAILHLGLNMPEDLRLVTHATCGVTLPYHRPVTRVEFDPTELANAAVDMMTVLITGKIPLKTNVLLPGTVVKGETT